jgi:hypothetical protein
LSLEASAVVDELEVVPALGLAVEAAVAPLDVAVEEPAVVPAEVVPALGLAVEAAVAALDGAVEEPAVVLAEEPDCAATA